MALPTGFQLRAARALAGLNAAELARVAGIDASTISRLESSRHKTVTGMAQTVEAVLRALAHKGVRINEDGSISPIKKPRR
jgi:transcriptional regulator with XRE-family HTH domain